VEVSSWIGLRRSYCHSRTILFDSLGTDTADQRQILDLFEGPVLLTILNYCQGFLWSDAYQIIDECF